MADTGIVVRLTEDHDLDGVDAITGSLDGFPLDYPVNIGDTVTVQGSDGVHLGRCMIISSEVSPAAGHKRLTLGALIP